MRLARIEILEKILLIVMEIGVDGETVFMTMMEII